MNGTGETRGTSQIKSNRLRPDSCKKINTMKYYVIHYKQDATKYDETQKPLIIDCQALYIGTKSDAVCIANDINHGGYFRIEEVDITKKIHNNKLICKTLL